MPLSVDLGLVVYVSGNTTRIQHETVLADWWNTRTDNTASSSWPAVVGPEIPYFSFLSTRTTLAVVAIVLPGVYLSPEVADEVGSFEPQGIHFASAGLVLYSGCTRVSTQVRCRTCLLYTSDAADE